MTNDKYWRGFLKWATREGVTLPPPKVLPKDGTQYLHHYGSFDAGAPGFYYALSRSEKQYGAGAIAVAFVIKVKGGRALSVARETMKAELFQQLTGMQIRELKQDLKTDEFQLYLAEHAPAAGHEAEYRWFVDHLPPFREALDYWVKWLGRA
jgi:hypothetical protein